MNIEQMLAVLNPEIVERLKTAVEIDLNGQMVLH